MSFRCDGIDFLVPLKWVREIADARGNQAGIGGETAIKPEGEGVRFLNLPQYFGRRENGCSGDYMIYLKNGPGDLALITDTVDGVRAVEEEKLLDLPEAVKTPANRFLEAVIPFDDGEELHMAYVIDPEILYTISLP